MFMKLFTPVLLVFSSAVTPVFSLPTPSPPSHALARDGNSTESNGNGTTVQKVLHLNDTAVMFPEMEYLWEGNQVFRSAVANSSNPSLLKDLATNGQQPEFLFLGCRFVGFFPTPVKSLHFGS
jgi:hypothetical protein